MGQRLNIPLESSVDTSGWEHKVNSITTPAFWRNDSVFARGGLNVMNKKRYDGSGIITRDTKIISVDGNVIKIDDSVVIDYGQALEKITAPEKISADAILLDGNNLSVATITSSTNCNIKTYTLDNKGVKTLASEIDFDIYPNPIKVCKLYKKVDVFYLVQITPTSFSINEQNYSIAISDNAKFIPHPQGWDIVDNKTVRTLNISGGTFEPVDNAVDARVLDSVVYYTLIGDVLNANKYRDIDSDIVESSPWNKPLPAGTPRIYSQTFHPLEPFTVMTDGRYYWWARVDGSDLMEVATDGAETPTYSPTTDFSRATDGLTSELTTQFNRTFNPTKKLEEVYQAGEFLLLGYNGVIIDPSTIDDYVYSVGGDTLYLAARELKTPGEWFLMTAGESVDINIMQIGRDMYKVNALSIYNILDANKNNVEIGSLDWNNRVIPEQVLRLFNQVVDSYPSESVVFNSAFGGNYEAGGELSTSILAGSNHLNLASPGSRKMLAPNALRPAAWSETNEELRSVIDYYYSPNDTVAKYQTTGFNHVRSDLNGLNYPEPSLGLILLPSPVNGNFSPNNLGISFLEWGNYLNIGVQYDFKFIDSYPLTSAITRYGNIFSISGATYMFDGNIIWNISFTDNQFDGRDYIVDTGGMIFIGSDSGKALFWASDGIIYAFTGSYQLSRYLDFTRIAKDSVLMSSAYNQEVDETILCFDNRTLRLRGEIISDIPYVIEKAVPTNKGTALLVDGEYLIIEPITVTDEHDENYLDTGYLGIAESDILAFNSVWIKFEGKATLEARTEILKDTIIASDVIKFNDVDEARIVPRGTSGRALRLIMHGDYNLKSLEYEVTKQSSAPALINRSK